MGLRQDVKSGKVTVEDALAILALDPAASQRMVRWLQKRLRK